MTTRPFLVGAILCAVAHLIPTSANAAPDATRPVPDPNVPKPVTVKTKKNSPRNTVVILKPRKRMDIARPMGVKAVVIDEPNLQTGTVSVVTDKNEFATISTGMGTRIARGSGLASLGNVHVGYTLRCYGAWDQDGFQYQASRIALGNSVSETTLISRINAACENIGKARKGGGFGQANVAMSSQTALPKALGIATGATPVTPVPAELVPGNTNPAMPAPVPGTAPAPVPVDPATVPPTTPNTVPVVPNAPVAPVP
ncbi:MAG: hypothetical protein H7Y38_14985 [Armatimonadetes bacterium]|nr:hypothetical protein [Armatimonadota bacterium]